MEMQKCELLSGINHFIKYAPGPGTCKPRAQEASGLRAASLPLRRHLLQGTSLRVHSKCLYSRERSAFLDSGVVTCWPLSLSFLRRIHTDPPKQTSKSLSPHSRKNKICGGRAQGTGSGGSKLCCSQLDLLYLYIWRKKFTKWVLSLIKCALSKWWWFILSKAP